jgi:hypothetical protein
VILNTLLLPSYLSRPRSSNSRIFRVIDLCDIKHSYMILVILASFLVLWTDSNIEANNSCLLLNAKLYNIQLTGFLISSLEMNSRRTF